MMNMVTERNNSYQNTIYPEVMIELPLIGIKNSLQPLSRSPLDPDTITPNPDVLWILRDKQS